MTADHLRGKTGITVQRPIGKKKIYAPYKYAFAVMSLKKYALYKWISSHRYSASIGIYAFFVKLKLLTLNPT